MSSDHRSMRAILKAAQNDLAKMAGLFARDRSYNLAKQAMAAAEACGELSHGIERALEDAHMDWEPCAGDDEPDLS